MARISPTVRRLGILAVMGAAGVIFLTSIAAIQGADAPSAFVAAAGDQQVTLSWQNPGDSTITGYQESHVAISKLVVPDTAQGVLETGDRFGESVGIDGDIAVVGAPLQESLDSQNASVTDGGWGHAFSKDSGLWSYDEYLDVSSPQVDGRLGSAVALNDRTAVIGAPSHTDSTVLDPGTVSITVKDSTSDSWDQKFTGDGETAKDSFGASVAMDDGIAVVGAPKRSIDGDLLAGKAYVFIRDSSNQETGQWSNEVNLDAGDHVAAGARFGWSVAVDGDTIVIGAPGEDSGRGAVYVFTKPAVDANSDGSVAWDDWDYLTSAQRDELTAKLTSPVPSATDDFGVAVAVDGDTVVVGAHLDDAGTDSGSVFVFTKPDIDANGDGAKDWDDWDDLTSEQRDELRAKLTASDTAAEDKFGVAVAIEGDTVVVGAHQEDENGTDSGSVYLFSKPSTGWGDATETMKLIAPDGAAGDEFGESLAVRGGSVIVGAPGDDSDTGAAYVFEVPEWNDIPGSGSGTTSHTVTGLTNNTEYTFWVRPVDASGSGPASGNKQATPQQSAADTPANLIATAGVGEVTLSWDDPNDSTITGYKYQQKSAGGTFGLWTDIPDSAYLGENTTGFTVPNLREGLAYTFRILAVDESGDSGFSNEATVTTIIAAPTGLVATAGAGQIELKWDDPQNNQITKYEHREKLAGGEFGSWNAIALSLIDSTSEPGALKYTVTRLSNGSEYTLELRAANDSVSGEAASVTATPLLAPPTRLVVKPYSERVVLEWDTDSHASPSHYLIKTQASGSVTAPADVTISAASGATTSYEFTSLTNDTAYTFSVQAAEILNNSTRIIGMAATASATPIPVPAAPTNLTTTAGDEEVELVWDKPSNSALTNYQLFHHAQRAKLVAGSNVPSEDFGVSVAIAGDIAVVGMPGHDDTDGDSGFAFVFSRSAGVWSQKYKLSTNDAVQDDGFGKSVAFDGETIVVGAPFDKRDDGGGNNLLLGAAYIFEKPATGWDNPSGTDTVDLAETAKLTASDGTGSVDEGDYFGSSVAVEGDVVVVGAYGHANTKGKVYIYTKSGGQWGSAPFSGVHRVETAQLTASNGVAGDYFGDSVAVDEDTIVVGADGRDNDRGSAYVFVKPRAGWANDTENAQLTASNGATGDEFGISAAIDGDVIAIGATGRDSDKGSIYLFVEPGDGWTGTVDETKELAASGGADNDRFGSSVALDDINVVVGAHRNEGSRGSAYVFTKPDTGWAYADEAAQLTAADRDTNDQFGTSVAVDNSTVVVGAINADDGTAYVFDIKWWHDFGDATTTADTATELTNDIEYTFYVRAENPSGPGPASDSASATPVTLPDAPKNLEAIPGDGQVTLNWDDPNDATITTYQYRTDDATFVDVPESDASTTSFTVTGLTNNTEYTLAVRAVNANGNGPAATTTATPIPVPTAPANFMATAGDEEVGLSWDDPGNSTITKYQLWQLSESAKLTGGSGNALGYGGSVAVVGDTVVVGLPEDDDIAQNSGAVLVYARDPNGAWTQTAKLKASDAAPDDKFGISVAFDGVAIVVGAYLDDDKGVDSGSAYVFTKSGGEWGSAPISGDHRVETAKLTASDGAAGDEFARDAVAVDGDTIVVGADKHDGTKGAAYVFVKPQSGWANSAETGKLTDTNASTGAHLGASAAIDGDTIVVGAKGGQNDPGAVFVFVKPQTGWTTSTETAELTASTSANNDLIGRSVAIDGDTIVVGAYLHDTNLGTAFVFVKPGPVWASGNETARLTASDRGDGDFFAYSVAVDGDVVAVGAERDDDAGSNTGAAYVFIKPGGGWDDANETVKLTASDAAEQDRFGNAVALSGDRIVIGAPGADATYVFDIADWADIGGSDATTTSHEITGLANFREYWFRVRAVNPSGAGPASTASATPVTLPDAPTNLSATPGDGRVTLNWDDPQDASITRYQYSDDGGANYTDIPDSGASTTSYTVTGLTNGTEHTLAVRAVSAEGNGPATTIDVLMVPSEPIGLFAVPGDENVELFWEFPDNATISGYQLMQLELGKLTGFGGAIDDRIGLSVAVDGDTAVVGASGHDGATGAAYVFARDPASGAWTRQARLMASDAAGSDNFGNSVAVSGDTALIGAYGDDDKGSDSGSAYVFAKVNGRWGDAALSGDHRVETAKLTPTDGAEGDWFGYSVALDGDTAVIGARKDTLNINGDDRSEAGSAYVFVRAAGAWSEDAKLTASDSNTNHSFGSSVALDGDTIVAGADTGLNASDDRSGAAYVFVKPARGWADATETAKLDPSDGEDFDFFGRNAAVDGDTIVVGSYAHPSDGKNRSGAAYVYAKPATTGGWLDWDGLIPSEKDELTAKLTASDGAANHYFGSSVAVSGDLALITAAEDDSNDRNAGSAYLFTRGHGGWSETLKITAPDGAGSDYFGWSAALDGDTAALGAYLADDGATDSGAAYILDLGDWAGIPGSNVSSTSHTATDLTNYHGHWFRVRAVNESGAGPGSNHAAAIPRPGKPGKPNGLSALAGDKQVELSWDDPGDSTIARYQISEAIAGDFLTASDAAKGDHFGVSIAIDGDTAVFGADRANGRKGKAYIFTRNSDGDWNEVADFDGENAGDQFGWSVAVDGDTVLVGAHAYDDNGNAPENSGAVYVYTKPSGGWGGTIATPVTLTAAVPEEYSLFGGSVDLDGDTIAIGSRLADVRGRTSAGAAYVFTKANNEWSQAARLTASDADSLDWLGYSVAVDGDTVLAGAFGTSPGFRVQGNGAAYLFQKPDSDDGWSDDNYNGHEAVKLTASDRQPADYFGFSVALDGDTAVIGARQHSDPDIGAGSGAAYVFTREAGVWGEKAKLTASDAAVGDGFGVSVALDGDTVAVGAWQDDDRGRNSGSAYVFEKPALGWTSTFESLKLTSPSGRANDRFGWSVAVDEDAKLALVGAYSDDHDANGDEVLDANAGSVHVLGIPDWVDIGSSDSGTVSHTVKKELDVSSSDLANGTEYSFQIRALNEGGAGSASDAVSATPLGKPETPKNLSANPGDSQVALSWDVATASSAIAPITKYEYSKDGGTSFQDIPGSDASTMNFTATGLTNETMYTFAVRAVNVIGASDSTTTDSTPVASKSDEPVLTATSGDTQVELTWEDPEDSSIDKYQYRYGYEDPNDASKTIYIPDNVWNEVPTGEDGMINREITVTDLMNGMEYKFEVRAVDVLNDGTTEDGDHSEATATPIDMQPGQPSNLVAKAGNMSVQLVWDDPNDDSIDYYQYSTDDGGEYFDISNFGNDDDDKIVYSIDGLTNGIEYTFVIRAVDEADPTNPSTKSDEAKATPLPEFPAAPMNLVPRLGVRQVTLNWVDPRDPTITAYEALHRLADHELIATQSSEDDKFGYAVTVDRFMAANDSARTSESVTVVVGAFRDDSNGVDSGAAYVFRRVDGVWGQPAKLTASDGKPYDNFGKSVAVYGDTVVIGAPGSDGDATDSGAVYVFVMPANGWVNATSTKLTPSDSAPLDNFGNSVAIHGDTVLVGAYGDDDEDNGFEDSGSAYLFTKPNTRNGWADWKPASDTETAKLTASDAADDDYFGSSVAVDGDVAVIGAPGDDDDGIDSGSVYVFTKSGGEWGSAPISGNHRVETAKLTASEGAAGDEFGYSVSFDDDTVAVGAPGDDDEVDDSRDSGSVYVFTWDAVNNDWVEGEKLTAEDRMAGAFFGFSVSVDDGTLLVGAPEDDGNVSESGSAYVFAWHADAGEWIQRKKLIKDDGEPGDRFGHAVAVNNAAHTAVVGAGSAEVQDIHDWEAIADSDASTTSHTVPNLFLNASYEFELRAVNLAGAGDEGTAQVNTVTRINRSPEARNDVVTTVRDRTVVINVLRNDTDVDGDELRVSSVGAPGNGSTSITGNQTTVTYTPASGFTGSDAFTYVVSDESGATDTGRVDVTVRQPAIGSGTQQQRNTAPTFAEGSHTTRTVREDAALGAAVGEPLLATDADRDQLRYSLSGHEQVPFDVDPGTGQLITTALLDHEILSEYSLKVTVEDDEGASDAIVVEIAVLDVDEPPSRPGAPDVRSRGETGLTVSWTEPTNKGPAITDYDVRYRESGNQFTDAPFDGTGTSTTLGDLKSGTSYDVQVRAANAEGISPWSASGRGATDGDPPPTDATPEPTVTPTLEPTVTPTPEPTIMPTPEPTVTPTPTPVPTFTPTPTSTPTPTPEPTFTPTPTSTPTPTPEPTLTPTPTSTLTPTPEPTLTPTPNSTPEPTRTPKPEPTPTTVLAPAPSPEPTPTTLAPMPTVPTAVAPETSGAESEDQFSWWWLILLLSIGALGVVVLVYVRRGNQRR